MHSKASEQNVAYSVRLPARSAAVVTPACRQTLPITNIHLQAKSSSKFGQTIQFLVLERDIPFLHTG